MVREKIRLTFVALMVALTLVFGACDDGVGEDVGGEGDVIENGVEVEEGEVEDD